MKLVGDNWRLSTIINLDTSCILGGYCELISFLYQIFVLKHIVCYIYRLCICSQYYGVCGWGVCSQRRLQETEGFLINRLTHEDYNIEISLIAHRYNIVKSLFFIFKRGFIRDSTYLRGYAMNLPWTNTKLIQKQEDHPRSKSDNTVDPISSATICVRATG